MELIDTQAPFRIYNASAGSGKTFSLVRDYLSLLFQSNKPDGFRHILAITFTNKAVAEMKSRIVESLISFSEEELSEGHRAMLDAVCEQTRIPSKTIQERAALILKQLIHNYAAFEVSTIDGFTHRVLRTFSKDLALPANFEVTMEVDDIYREAVDRLIANAGDDKLLTKILIDFTLSKADDDKSWDISRELYAIARLLSNEANLEHLQALKGKTLQDFEAFSKELSTYKKSLEIEIRNLAEVFFSLLNENKVNTENAFSGKYAYTFFTKILSAENQDLTGINLDAAWQKNLFNDSKNLYAKNKLTKDQEATLDSIQPKIAELFEASKIKIRQIDFINRISKNTIPLSLLNRIKEEVDAIKKERGLLLISEFNKTISEAIKGQPAPFIYERLGERYRHFFIDEFQDTSELQWENLIPLVENPLSSQDEQGNQGSLLIVGDAKQSIYRWRGGKPEQFIDLYNQKTPFTIASETTTLPDNYRSLPQVVNFNNSLFKHLGSKFTVEDYKHLYDNSPQNSKKKEKGYVNLQFLDVKNKDEEHERFPEEIVSIIRDCETRGYSKSDICILTRRRKEGVTIANYLSAEGISVISSETLLIKNSPEVNCLINILKLAENPEDRQTQVQLIQFLIDTKRVEEELTAFSLQGLSKPLSEFYSRLEEYGVSFNPKKIEDLPLYDTLEYIVDAFSLIETSNAYVHYFLDFGFNYASQNLGGVTGFLEHWQQHEDKLSIVVPDGEDAVKLLTIHRAKGLEFPVVIFPYANQNLEDYGNDNIWVDLPEPFNDIPQTYVSASTKLEGLHESVSKPFENLTNESQMDAINVLYVALTRAEEQLYILGKQETKQKYISGLLIDFLKSDGSWVDDTWTFSYGEPHSKVSIKKEASVESIEQKGIATGNFNERAVELATNSGRLWGTPQQQAIDEGLLIHELMSKIDKASDVVNVISEAEENGLGSSEEKELLEQKVYAIVNHPELVGYFSNEAVNYNEREMVSASGNLLRTDRINILNTNEAVIIDYKTGTFSRKHEAQVLEYSETLAAMGYRVSKRILVYTNAELTIKNV